MTNLSTLDIQWECVRFCEEDASLVFAWRNDPDTRAMSFHADPLIWEDFYPSQFKRFFKTPSLPSLFARWNDQRVAFLFFEDSNHPVDTQRRCCTISINVHPKFRSQGLGTKILQQIQPWLSQRGYETILAEVKMENAASIKSFEKAGFIRLQQQEKEIVDLHAHLPIYLFKAELAPFSSEGMYIIAEAGSNWRMGTPKRDLAMAKALIEAAADAGADAVKFQLYRPQTIYVANAGTSSYLAQAGVTEEITDIFADLAMPYEMLPELAKYCSECRIAFLSTPFSPEDFAQVDPYVIMHKIASYEIGHLRLLECAARSKKPLILSTGAATIEEIDWAIDYYRNQGGQSLTLLQCTAAYPAHPGSLNLAAIPWMHQYFKVNVGLSDHSRDPLNAPIAATALGATMIEKHFTLHNQLPGPDHFFAVTASELKQMVKAVRSTYQMVGKRVKEVSPQEAELRSYAKRGIQAIQNIRPGDILKEGENVAILRPGNQPIGMAPRFLPQWEGKRFIREISIGQGVYPSDLKE